MKTYLKILLIFILFNNSCTLKKTTGEPSLPAKDSLEIVQLFQGLAPGSATSDSVILSHPKEYQNIASRHFYNTSRFKYLIQSGRLKTADSLLNIELTKADLDTTSVAAARYYNLLASVYAYQTQQEKAIRYFKRTLTIFDSRKDFEGAARIQFNIANIFLSRLDYSSAYDYAKKSSRNFTLKNDTVYLPVALAISAVSAININKKAEAKTLSRKALALSEKYHNILGKSLSAYALAEIYLFEKDYTKAISSFNDAVALAEQTRQIPTEVASLTSLSKVYLELKDYQQVILIAVKALQKAKLVNNDDILYTLNRHLSLAYEQSGNTQKAYIHLKEADRYFREKITTGNPKALQELLVAYEAEKKEKQIAEQKLKIQKQRSNLVDITLGSAFLISMLGAVFIYNRKAQKLKLKRLQQEKENTILNAIIVGEEREKNRISHELHDGVAAMIGAAKLSLESIPHLPQEKQMEQILKVSGLLENTHADVRHIAHNLFPAVLEKDGIVKATEHFAAELNQIQMVKVTVTRKKNSEVNHLSRQLQLMLFRVIQELVNNILKHAEAKNAEITFSKHPNGLQIEVSDDGIGYNGAAETGSQGLYSIAQRVKSIGGDFKIMKNGNMGTTAVVIINA
ncbi:tetratricopeptide repeat-containing sensor histidine kinase [Pedobacter insulae]|uniref:Tetratricopeptide repeat-containing protein n=1 Tax=Pedobacter insulae TaxID=414048 RepID=A0A1I2XFZ2_9SPHI|nr:sensor histidine kinase [Pedobacter insulae]SFH12420.1 Tetratricopeptide repeat-containing protein [Pedobacter insulae]